jgi:hypothetical protein
MFSAFKPKFAKRYCDAGALISGAITSYIDELGILRIQRAGGQGLPGGLDLLELGKSVSPAAYEFGGIVGRNITSQVDDGDLGWAVSQLSVYSEQPQLLVTRRSEV